MKKSLLTRSSLILLIALNLCLLSCKKDPTQPDPIQEKIAQLRADSIALAKEVRNAVVSDKTVESDISSYFNMVFGQEITRHSYDGGSYPDNIVDSAKIFVKTVEVIWEENGNPPPLNGATIQNLYDKSNALVSIATELALLLNPSAQDTESLTGRERLPIYRPREQRCIDFPVRAE